MPRITNMKETGVKTTGQTFFFVGAPNTGKTHMATTFPGPILVLNFDGKQNNWANTDATLIEYEVSKDTAAKEYASMLNHIRALKKGEAIKINDIELIPAGKKFNTIVVDSMTTLGSLAWPLALMFMPEPPPGQPDSCYQKRYAKQKTLMSEPIEELRNLATIYDANVIIIAHHTEEYDNANDMPTGTFKPSLVGKLKEYIPSVSCEVYWFTTKKLPGNQLAYECWTRTQKFSEARSSMGIGAFPEKIENIYDAWEHYATRYAKTRLPHNVQTPEEQVSTPVKPETKPETKGGNAK